ncbi:MAG: hypothetical protein NC121_16075 [Blautia sp.]|nr:hypothetical protein [Blautia sp.]
MWERRYGVMLWMEMNGMDRMEIFQILGIEETKDEKQIRNAYRERLSVTNPEDDPEGFKRLRSAYDAACMLAKQKDEDRQEQPRDTTPSGLWMEKAAEIYRDIRTRQNLRLWEELFMDDCFLSLEDEENCRFKLLRFLMEHIKLPTDVWKLLDKKLSITGDAARLREQFPGDFVRYILNKCERGETVDFTQFEGPEDGDYDLFLQYYDRTRQALIENKPEEAAQCIGNADRLGIRHPELEICRGELLNRQGKFEEALALMEELRAKYPKNTLVESSTAEMLWKHDQDKKGHFRERAAQIYQELKEENDDYYMANLRLAEWHYEQGQYRKAKGCAEKVLSGGSDEAFMKLLGRINKEIEKELEQEYRKTKGWKPALELCWCYLQDGRIAKGIMLADSLNGRLPPEKDAEYKGLMAKLYVEEAEYEDSIAMTRAWEEALYQKLESDEPGEREKDLDRLKQARMIRMQCYHNLGFRDREQFRAALEEGRAALTGSVKDIGILMEMAQLYMEMEEYEQCLDLVDRLVEEYQVYAAYAVALEAYLKQRDAGGVIRSSTQCIRYFPGFVKAYEYAAEVFLNLNCRDDLEELLENAEKNDIKSDVLDAYRYLLTHKAMDVSILNNKLRFFRTKYRDRVEKGETFLYQEGLRIVTEYLYLHPDAFMFVERGMFHKAAHHYKEAKEDFEKALVMEPENCYALNGLSQVYRAMGDCEKALFYVKRAILYRTDAAPSLYVDMGHLYSLLGDFKRAMEAHLHVAELTGQEQRGMWNLVELADCMARVGEAEAAEKLYLHVYQNDSQTCYLYRVSLAVSSGNERKARELLEAWRKELGLEKDNPLQWRLMRSLHGEMVQAYNRYFQQAAWVEMVFGSSRAADRYFRQVIADKGGDLGDVVFGFLVCGDHRQGKKYSAKLRVWLNQQSFQAQDDYYDSPRLKLFYRALGSFYASVPGTVQSILDQQETAEICSFCTNPFCKELEGVRILYLYHQGKEEEARKRLRRNLEIFPRDEYMLAIRHTVFHDTI